MYPRQFKQFLKSAQPDFDERRYGSINDLMRAGLQIMLLPKNLHAYYTPDEPGVVSTIWRNRDTPGDGMKAMMEQLDARWINHERKVGECALLKAQIFGAAPEGNTPKPTALSL